MIRMTRTFAGIFSALLIFSAAPAVAGDTVRGTMDLGIIIERAAGAVRVVDTSKNEILCRIGDLGDLSHASAVFSRDGRFAFVFGRDGGLSKLDILSCTIAKRIVQSGNSIGGAISQDGRLIAVANYTPGGIKVFSAATLEILADIPSSDKGDGTRSKTVGLVDAPGNRFVFTLYDTGEIWVVDFTRPESPVITKFTGAGKLPYDALVTPEGRYYIAGLFGEDGLVLLDLWHPEKGLRRILNGYGKGEEPLPVFKMPHLEGVATVGDELFLPAVGRHEILVAENKGWNETGRIAVHGQPVFAVASPDQHYIWVNFAHPDNDVVQVIDTQTHEVVKTLRPGAAVLHMEFTPRGDRVWISVRDEDKVVIYDAYRFDVLGTLSLDKPSGIFFAHRGTRIGL